jgi:tetratricopeptide (TPR) repeat protein
MQKVSGMANPLLESAAVRNGSGLAFRQFGALVDPMTRQMAFDFELAPVRPAWRWCGAMGGGASQAGRRGAGDVPARGAAGRDSRQRWTKPSRLYETILEMQPVMRLRRSTLGRSATTSGILPERSGFYRQATEADPEYALAFFDLGNVLDEQQRLAEAIVAYERALKLVPQYADAHYNLALAYERLKEPRKALRHWTSYVQLDPTGPWAKPCEEPGEEDPGASGWRL